MQKEINYIWGVRNNVLRAIRNFNNEQLNQVPPGFNNNLIWNLTHMIATQQDLFYIHTGLGIRIDPEIYFNFKIGTRPIENISDSGIQVIKGLALSTIRQLQEDFEAGVFSDQAELPDLLTHFVFHEGMHMAYILSIRRLLVYQARA